jgi:hypothetical protein
MKTFLILCTVVGLALAGYHYIAHYVKVSASCTSHTSYCADHVDDAWLVLS